MAEKENIVLKADCKVETIYNWVCPVCGKFNSDEDDEIAVILNLDGSLSYISRCSKCDKAIELKTI